MQLRVTFSLVHYLEPAISWKQILIVLFPFIYRQWTLSWSEHCQLQMPGSNLLLAGYFHSGISLMFSYYSFKKKLKNQKADDRFWSSNNARHILIFMHEWPKEKHSLFLCNLVISLSVEKVDNKYWQYIRLGCTKSYPLLSWAAAVINFQT